MKIGFLILVQLVSLCFQWKVSSLFCHFGLVFFSVKLSVILCESDLRLLWSIPGTITYSILWRVVHSILLHFCSNFQVHFVIHSTRKVVVAYFWEFNFTFRGWSEWILTFARPRMAKPMNIIHDIYYN